MEPKNQAALLRDLRDTSLLFSEALGTRLHECMVQKVHSFFLVASYHEADADTYFALLERVRE